MGNYLNFGLSTGLANAAAEFGIIVFFVGIGIFLKFIRAKVAMVALFLGILALLFPVILLALQTELVIGESNLSGVIFMNLILGSFIISLFGFTDDSSKVIATIVASLSFLILFSIILVTMLMTMFP